jgi:hypothetical protein
MGASNFLESMLKWASVAYALGFVTVMANTARIGVPTLQLLDPIQIWVGIPLALVFLLVFAVAKHFRKLAEQAASDAQRQEAQFKQLFEVAQTGNFAPLMDKFFELVGNQVPGIGSPLVYVIARIQGNWFKQLINRVAVLGKQGEVAGARNAEQKPEEITPFVDGLTKLLAKTYVWGSYVSNAVYVALVLLAASVAYVVFVYPIVPQSWGGGRPTIVRMSIETERIPSGEKEFRTLFPAQQGPTESSKSTLSRPLTLLYSTEHAYYIRLSSGEVMQINPEAVSAIIFDTKAPSLGSN